MPKIWPLARKGRKKKFIAVPSHSLNKGISLLFILRDMLKIVYTRKEARYITSNSLVKVNNKIRKDENFPVKVLDTISLEKENLNYRLEIINKKFKLKKITNQESKGKTVKISGKKILSKKRVQINLDDGQNFLTKEKFSVGDSVIINTQENKIDKILSLKRGVTIEITLGKHAGEKGKLIGFKNLPKEKNCIVKIKEKEVVLPYKAVLVIEDGK